MSAVRRLATSGAAMAPSAGRRRGGRLVAASRFVRGSQRVLRTSRTTRHVPLSGPRGRRRDSVDELRALLPDPQLHRRLRESELQLLALVAQPPLGLQLPTIGPGSDRSIPVLPASTNRSRQLSTVAEDTPCRRAALASDNSPFNTAN